MTRSLAAVALWAAATVAFAHYIDRTTGDSDE